MEEGVGEEVRAVLVPTAPLGVLVPKGAEAGGVAGRGAPWPSPALRGAAPSCRRWGGGEPPDTLRGRFAGGGGALAFLADFCCSDTWCKVVMMVI